MDIDTDTVRTPSQTRKAKNVTLRNGAVEPYDVDRIRARLEKLTFGLDKNYLNLDLIIKKTEQGLYDGIKTTEIDNLTAETAAYMNLIHPQYSTFAARIAVNNLHKETKESFAETISDLYNYIDNTGRPASLIADDVYQIVMANADRIQQEITYERDYNYDFFGFKTLERSYLLRIHGNNVERPQHMLMRVSIGIHKEDLESAFETYHLMSQKWFTHATPTLFNAGTPKPQLSSCFLLTMKDDSILGIYETLKQCALISKSAGGIGLAIHNIRAKDSYIRGTNGVGNGIVPMLRVFNDTARYVDQGGGKRKGAFAIYLEPWHADIFDFLQLRKNHGKEEQRARDLFFALWICDLFMARTEKDEDWTLMCPNECPGLSDVYGEEFEALYTKYEREGKGRQTIKARKLWNEIVQSQIETGTPFILYKDSANRKSNQKNLGTIKSSNLCTEIMEYTSPDEVAVCNLASISLPKFVDSATKTFDFTKLEQIAYIITKNLNKIIDINYYPVKEAENSNLRHRPIGIGVQGLADVLQKMRIPYESEQGVKLDEKIFETIYYGALRASNDLARELGPYTTYQGSPASQGILQFDMWNKAPSQDYDWNGLKQKIAAHGLRNSLLIAPMPTASTSQILGNNESFEPYTTNLYTRRVLAGEFVCINPHLVHELIERDLWNAQVKNKLLAYGGSVQNIAEIPQEMKDLYKTIWEISQKSIIDHAAARSPFIDQSQSLNIYLSEPSYGKITSMHFYAWRAGLKTGMYYLRTRPAADAIKFTVDVEMLLKDGGQIEIKNSAMKNIQNTPNLLDKENRPDEPEVEGSIKKVKIETKTTTKVVTCSLQSEDGQCMSCGS